MLSQEDKEEIERLIKQTIKESLRVNVYVGAPSDITKRVRVSLLLDGAVIDDDEDKG
jgi:hypothetical protein